MTIRVEEIAVPNQLDAVAANNAGALMVSWVLDGGAWNPPAPVSIV